MRIGRTVPPAAAPLCWRDLWHGAAGALSPARSLRTLEEQIRRHFGVRHVFLVSSGTAALTLTLRALRSLSDRTEVVIPAYTCFSVAAAVAKAGLRPVLCDIDPSTFDFDHALLEQALSRETLCVLAHHLFGIPSDIERIRALCSARGIFVVEDAAQAMGAEDKGHTLGTLGDVGIFSLGRGKNITCGSGGIMVTSSQEIAGAIAKQYRHLEPPTPAEVLKDFTQLVLMAVFIRPRLYWIPAALPFLRLGQTIYPTEIPLKRLSGMQAGLLGDWRSHLARSNRIRSETSSYFKQRLPLPLAPGPSRPYLRLPVLVASPKERERIRARSQERGLGIAVAYPTPINEIPEIRAAFSGQRFPSAQRVAERLLTIPTHHLLSENDKRAIAECVATMSEAIDPPAACRRAS
jgi:dTDP-4-amino-4,6-dideoxygalactose transaminase